MDKKKLQKGMYGFHNKKRRYEVIKTIIFFGIALAVYFTGLLHTGTNKNLLTIVAIVGVLPASKSAVNMIMFVRFKGVSEALYKQIEGMDADEVPDKKDALALQSSQGIVLYDLIFVLNEKVVKTDCIYVKDTSLVVYTEQSSMNESEISKYLKNFLANHGKGSVSVKVCKTQKAFIEQIKRHMNSEISAEVIENQNKLRDMLFGFSM